MTESPEHPSVTVARRRAYQVAGGWLLLGSAIAWLRVLPDAGQVALVITTWGGAPIAARTAGFRALADVPPEEQAAALAAIDRALLGSSDIHSVGCGWILSRLAIATTVIVVACLVLLAI